MIFPQLEETIHAVLRSDCHRTIEKFFSSAISFKDFESFMRVVWTASNFIPQSRNEVCAVAALKWQYADYLVAVKGSYSAALEIYYQLLCEVEGVGRGLGRSILLNRVAFAVSKNTDARMNVFLVPFLIGANDGMKLLGRYKAKLEDVFVWLKENEIPIQLVSKSQRSDVGFFLPQHIVSDSACPETLIAFDFKLGENDCNIILLNLLDAAEDDCCDEPLELWIQMSKIAWRLLKEYDGLDIRVGRKMSWSLGCRVDILIRAGNFDIALMVDDVGFSEKMRSDRDLLRKGAAKYLDAIFLLSWGKERDMYLQAKDYLTKSCLAKKISPRVLGCKLMGKALHS